VQLAFTLWLVAIAAGVFETALALTRAVAGDDPYVGVAVRCAVFIGAAFAAVQMRVGKRWARVVLALVLGLVGTLSLVIGPIIWLVEGHPLGGALANADTYSVLFSGSRVVHLAAVLGAVVFMFRPAANSYFRTTRALSVRSG
jgi:hypothetical protein